MKKRIIALLTLLILCGFAYYFIGLKKQAQLAAMLANRPAETILVMPAIIDGNNDITHIPSLQAGVIKKIVVSVGQTVKKGDLLFALDNIVAKRNVRINQRLLIQAQNNLVIPTKDLKHAENQLERLKSLDPRAISKAELREKIHEVKIRKIQLEQAKQGVALARTNLNNSKLSLSQFETRAPKDGIVLQINAHVDEFVGGGQHIVLLGDAKNIIVRVSIDERDINSIAPEKDVFLTNSTYNNINIPLKFIQLDRFIIFHDRLNSRVQEALYSLSRNDYPNFVAGQQVDVHIPTKPTT